MGRDFYGKELKIMDIWRDKYSIQILEALKKKKKERKKQCKEEREETMQEK